MLRISQLKLPITHTKEDLEQRICKLLRLSKTPSYTILRRSVDARKKPELFFQYSIDVEAEKEDQVYKHCDRKQVMRIEKKNIISRYRVIGERRDRLSSEQDLRDCSAVICWQRPVLILFC